MGAISARYYVEHLGGAEQGRCVRVAGGREPGHDLGRRMRGARLVSRDGARVVAPRPPLAERAGRRAHTVRGLVVAVRPGHPPAVERRAAGCAATPRPPVSGHSDLKTNARVVTEVLAFIARPHYADAPESPVHVGRRPRSRVPEVPSAGGRRRNLRRSRPRGGVLPAIIVTES